MGILIQTLIFLLHFNDNYGDKIALYGASIQFGFGIQNSLLQIHGSNSGMILRLTWQQRHFTENVRIKGNGNLGIGLTTPQTKLHVRSGATALTPNPNASATIEDDDFTFLNILSNQESGVLFDLLVLPRVEVSFIVQRVCRMHSV
ncbi:MAG: hypothetical protein IPP30_04350 [Flavobacterium sp.]|nr:hypothetical protein [Flavobacterium sp.]